MSSKKTPLPPHKPSSSRRRYVICVINEGYSASLEKRKIYPAVPDSQAGAHDLVRVIDESGDDYLYPAGWFLPITLSPTVVKALALAV